MTVEDDAVVSQSVDVWRRDLIRTVETDVIPTLCSKHVSTVKQTGEFEYLTFSKGNISGGLSPASHGRGSGSIIR